MSFVSTALPERPRRSSVTCFVKRLETLVSSVYSTPPTRAFQLESSFMLPPDAAPIHTFVPSVLWLGDEPDAKADRTARNASPATMPNLRPSAEVRFMNLVPTIELSMPNSLSVACERS